MAGFRPGASSAQAVQQCYAMGLKRVVLAGILAAHSALAQVAPPGELPGASQSEHSVVNQQRGQPSEADTKPEPDVATPRSEREPQGWTRDHVALLVHLGIGAPTGALGVTLDLAPIRFVALQLGAGASLNGLQLAAMPRLRLPIGKRALLTLGDGVSTGRYQNDHEFGGLACVMLCVMESMGERSATQTWQRAYWNNFELGFDEFAAHGTGVFRGSVGYAVLLNEHAYTCDPGGPSGYGPGKGCDRTGAHSMVYVSAEFGFFL